MKNKSSLWLENGRVYYIDQTLLPWEVKIRELSSMEDAIRAITRMEVRGAPLIGVAAAFGFCLAAKEDAAIEEIAEKLKSTRPTAINLAWAVDQMMEAANRPGINDNGLFSKATEIRQSEIDRCHGIGIQGLHLIEEMSLKKRGETLNILTHCNAGWLASVEWGTALAPIYMAHDKGIKIHVWVDETRPRNQGAKLTAWELQQWGVPCTVIPDSTGGHLMQNGMVDMVIVGTDRTAANGDVANKIGTYLKALAASDNNIPFYVAMPWSTYDPETPTGKDITIEERDEDEIRIMDGYQISDVGCQMSDVRCRIIPDGTPVVNYGFDITPAELISGYITEKGIFDILEGKK
jgi:methylthioribose-1-phosphate isomerase